MTSTRSNPTRLLLAALCCGALAFASSPRVSDGWTSYGVGFPGTAGKQPALRLAGCAQVGGRLQLAVVEGLNSAPGVFAIGQFQGHFVLPSGLELWINPKQLLMLQPIQLDARGVWSTSWLIGPGTAGTTLNMQAVLLDPGAVGQLSASDAVELTIP